MPKGLLPAGFFAVVLPIVAVGARDVNAGRRQNIVAEEKPRRTEYGATRGFSESRRYFSAEGRQKTSRELLVTSRAASAVVSPRPHRTRVRLGTRVHPRRGRSDPGADSENVRRAVGGGNLRRDSYRSGISSGPGSDGELLDAMPRQTRNSKRPIDDVEVSVDVTELQRAVKRMNTGGGPNGETFATETERGVHAKRSPVRPPMDEHECDANHGVDVDARTPVNTEYAEINAMLRTLHFARVRRRESLALDPRHYAPHQ